MQRKQKEIFATCASCDNGDRKSFMEKGELYCKRDNRRVSTNALCESYKHAGATLVQIERRAKAHRAMLVVQPDFFRDST